MSVFNGLIHRKPLKGKVMVIFKDVQDTADSKSGCKKGKKSA